MNNCLKRSYFCFRCFLYKYNTRTGAPATTKGRGRFKPEGTLVPNQAWEAYVNFDTRTASLYKVSKISTVQTLRSKYSLRAYIIVWADFQTSPSTCLWKDQERHFNFFLRGKFFLYFSMPLDYWKIGRKQHFICSNLTLSIVPFFLFFSFFSLFFLFFLFFLSFFLFFFFLGGDALPAPP